MNTRTAVPGGEWGAAIPYVAGRAMRPVRPCPCLFYSSKVLRACRAAIASLYLIGAECLPAAFTRRRTSGPGAVIISAEA